MLTFVSSRACVKILFSITGKKITTSGSSDFSLKSAVIQLDNTTYFWKGQSLNRALTVNSCYRATFYIITAAFSAIQ